MIQRVQSVYLLLAFVIVGTMFIFPLGAFLGGIEHFRLTLFGLSNGAGVVVEHTVFMAILATASALLPVVTIFLYKKRLLQIRLCRVGMILLAVLQLAVCFYLWRTARSMAGFTPNAFVLSVAAAAPAIAFILVWFAMRGVARDEAKVRSIDRIR